MCLTSSARRLLVGFILLLALAAALQPPAGAKEKKVTKQERARIQEQIAELPPQYRVWLAQVAILITREEVATFLTLKENYQRDAFVEAFWKSRDTRRETGFNEFRDRYMRLMEEVALTFDNLEEERARMLL